MSHHIKLDEARVSSHMLRGFANEGLPSLIWLLRTGPRCVVTARREGKSHPGQHQRLCVRPRTKNRSLNQLNKWHDGKFLPYK